MLTMGLTETMDQLYVANSMCLYNDVLWKEDGDALRRALELEVEGQRQAIREMDEAH